MRWMLALSLGILLAAVVSVQCSSIARIVEGPPIFAEVITTTPQQPSRQTKEPNLLIDHYPFESRPEKEPTNHRNHEDELHSASPEVNGSKETGESNDSKANGQQDSGDKNEQENHNSYENSQENGNGVEKPKSKESEENNQTGLRSDEHDKSSSENGQSGTGNEEDSVENNKNSKEDGKNHGWSKSASHESEKTSKEDGQSGSGELSVEASKETQVSEEAVSDEAKSDVIETESGPVQGYLLHQHAIRSYLDIPYGKYRKLFAAPESFPPWEETLAVREHNKRCPQLDVDGNLVGDFDCLTLSIFTPKNADNAPVLFHVYDSEFMTGSADFSIYGPEYFTNKGAIVVLPNYRVGPLGFLCLRNDIAPGNAALKDLALALEWTKDNIAKFGGNASNIIVSGDGMTAALAGYLALSSKSKALVGGVITESGSPLAHWALDRYPTDLADKFPNGIKDELIKSEVEGFLKATKNIAFRPCVENGTEPFLNATPWEILHCEQKIDIPFMIGAASNAGMQEAVQETEESLEQLDKKFDSVFPDDLQFERDADKTKVANKVRKLYFDDRSIRVDELKNVALLYTDAYYLSPAIRFSRGLLEAGAKVFLYEFSFVGAFNRELHSMKKRLEGAARGDIVGYTFTQDQEMPTENSEEEKMVNLITDLWLNFMKFGEPSSENVIWNELKEDEENWLSIGAKTESVQGFHLGRLQLWTEIYKNHFVERNIAVSLQSSLVLFTTVFLLLGVFKGL